MQQLFNSFSFRRAKCHGVVSPGLFFAPLLCACILFSCNQQQHKMQKVSAHAFRLKPGQDLKAGIQQLVADKQIKAGWVSTCVGSLTNYNIRFANQPNGSFSAGHFEIVSLTGTVSVNGSHLHLSISDSIGNTIGGHLMEGCLVYTTAEIVILSSNVLEFKREKDGTTPWEELQVKQIDEK
jgi:uncharacterized protein